MTIFCSQSGSANAAHKVFDTWSEPGTQPGSEGNHAQHMFDTIPNPQGRVLHVVVHQYQQSVSPELISQVFSAYGEVEEMFHSPHQNSPTSTSSIFIEYAHASMADDALHGLHGLYLYQDDCWLEIRHANSSELQAFYGYSAPSFSEEQLELLQQIKKDLQALSQNGTFGLVDVCMGTDLKPTPPTQNNHNAAIFPVSACESLCSEDKQAEIDYKEQEKHFKHGPTQLQLEFESLPPCAIKTLDAESAMDRASVDNIDQVLHQWPTKEQQFNDNSSATLAALPVAIPILDDSEEFEQNVAEVEKILTPAVFHMSQPWASLLDSNYQQPVTSMTLHSAPSQKKVPHVLALIPGSNNVREPSVIISDLCGHIKTSPLMIPWDPGTLHCTQWEVSKPIKEGKFSCLQFVLLLFTMHYTVIHSTYLTCLCISLPWEDPGAMHVLQLIDCKWTPSAMVSIFRKHQLLDICQVYKQYEKQSGSTFNEVQLRILTSTTHELVYQPGENSQWQSITWKSETLGNFLLFLTTRAHSVYLLLPWDPGVQQQHLSALCQIMRRKKIASSLANQFDENCIPHRNPKCEKFCDIQLVGLTVCHYSFSRSEMVMLLGISSFLECYSLVGAALVQLNHHFISHFMVVVPCQYLDTDAGVDYLEGIITKLGDAKESEDWHMNEQGNVCMMLIVCQVVLPYKIAIHYIRELNSKCGIFWAASYQLPRVTMAIVDLDAVKNNSAILASVMIIQYSSRNEVQALEIAIELCALLRKPADTIISSLFMTTSMTELRAHGQWEQGPHNSEIQNMLLLLFLQYVSVLVQLLQHFDTRKSKLLGIKLLTHILVQAPENTAKIIILFPKMNATSVHIHEATYSLSRLRQSILGATNDKLPRCLLFTMWTCALLQATKVHCNYLLAVEVSTFTCNTDKTGRLASYYKVSTFSSWELQPVGLSWHSGCLAICCGLRALISDSRYCSQVLVIMHKSNSDWLSVADHCPSVRGYFLNGFWPNNLQNISCSVRPSFGNTAVSHYKLHQLGCIGIIAEIKDLQFSTTSCIGPEQNVVQLVFLERDNTYANSESTTWDPGIILYRNLQPDSDTHYKISTYIWIHATKGMLGFYLKNISNLLHRKILGWVPKMWIVSFMPP